MSLINDALKRANQAARQKSDPPSPPGGSMQPVDPGRGVPQARSNVVAILLVVVIGMAGLFFVLWWNTRRQTPSVAQRSAERSEQVVTAPVALSPSPSTESPADARRPRIQINTNIVIRELPAAVDLKPQELPVAVVPSGSATPPVSSLRSDSTASEAPAVPVSFPTVKLQGIFFRLKNPEAVVNGKILRVGETVLGVKVTRIDRREVGVEWNGQSKTLSLDGP